MGIRWGRVIAAAVGSEVLAIMLLVVIVALFGPRDQAAVQEYAERLGQWVGPLGGATFCFLSGFWVARSASQRVLHGVLVGVVAAIIDIALLVASGASPFHLLFIASNAGRVAAGGLGGWVADVTCQRPPS